MKVALKTRFNCLLLYVSKTHLIFFAINITGSANRNTQKQCKCTLQMLYFDRLLLCKLREILFLKGIYSHANTVSVVK